MAEQQATDDTPIFNLQRIYVKDISFENPNSPEVFAEANKQPKVKMSMDLSHRKVNDEHWEVIIKINAETRVQESDKLVFEIEVEQAGVFFFHNIPEEHIPLLLNVDCPTIIFPYTRQIISQLSVDGGFMPFTLEPVNFNALYQAKLQEVKEKENVTVQ
ncbi:protein-export chaperone SecB [Ghiorsea bivora]|uniref:protein-export chaperone SecB n=1 Tax=Ghiorsea bivora TaxID=1485545 RepID=UPI00056ED868|nr:protein-export chaperone SecB [Ghiorsea bivora]